MWDTSAARKKTKCFSSNKGNVPTRNDMLEAKVRWDMAPTCFFLSCKGRGATVFVRDDGQVSIQASVLVASCWWPLARDAKLNRPPVEASNVGTKITKAARTTGTRRLMLVKEWSIFLPRFLLYEIMLGAKRILRQAYVLGYFVLCVLLHKSEISW